MAEGRTCGECGAPLTAATDEGFCPKCLLLLGLHGGMPKLRIRCPHCHNPVEVIDDEPAHEVVCPSCDSRFRLIDDNTLTRSTTPPKSVGQFDLLECVGSGGFGSVWKARDNDLDRLVAIKIPRSSLLSAEESEQFLREARAAAQLSHANIVRVYEVGRSDGQMFIVSDYVDGVTLADQLVSRRMTVQETVNICADIASALHHAHQHGVIHRDLKPSNVLLERRKALSSTDATDSSQGGAQKEVAAWIPHITDFGLARRESGEITMTIDGRIIGTPAYMSPEQARGEGHTADARSDVYSLGVMLFEMLTGEKPFRGSSRMLLDQVLHEDAPLPRKLNANVPRDLETICLKCLEKDPARRYQSAGLMADELHRYRRGEAILARPVTRVQRGVRWCRRNPVVAGLSAAIALSLLVGLIATSWQWRVATRNFKAAAVAESRERSEREKATALAAKNRTQLVQHHVAQGTEALVQGDHLEAAVWFAEGLSLDQGNPERETTHRRRLTALAASSPALHQMLFHDHDVRECFYTADGSKVVTSSDRFARIWHAHSGELICDPLEHQEFIWTVVLSPAGDRFLTCSMHPNATSDREPHLRQLRMYDTDSGQQVFPALDLPDLYPDGWFSPDGSWFVLCVGSQVQVRSSETGNLIYAPLEHPAHANRVAISPDGRRLLTSSGESETVLPQVRLWDFTTGEPIGKPMENQKVSRERAFSRDSQWFVTVESYDYYRRNHPDTTGSFQVCRADTGQPSGEAIASSGAVRTAVFLTPQRLMTIEENHLGRLWEVDQAGCRPLRRQDDWANDRHTPAPLREEKLQRLAQVQMRHVANFRGPAISPEGRRMVTIHEQGLQFWDIETGEPLFDLSGELSTSDHVEFSPDGRRLFSIRYNWHLNRGEARLWDLFTEDSWSFPVPSSLGVWPNFSPDGDLAIADHLGVVRIWSLKSMAPYLEAVEGLSPSDVCYAATSPDGKVLAVCSGPHDMNVDRGGAQDWGRVQLFDLPSRRPLGSPLGIDARAQEVVFSPDSRQLAAVDRYGFVSVFAVPSGQLVSQPTAPDEKVRVDQVVWQDVEHLVAVTRDDDRWVPGDPPRSLRRWTAATGQLAGAPRPVAASRRIMLAPGGATYAAVDQEGKCYLADAHDDRVMMVLGQVLDDQRPIAFQPDGSRLVTIDRRNAAHIWDTESGNLVAPLIHDVKSVRFSPSGRLLIVWNLANETTVYDVETGELLTPAFITEDLVEGPSLDARCFFSPDEHRLLAITEGAWRVWPLWHDQFSARDWQIAVQLASGHKLDPVAGYSLWDGSAQQQLWLQHESGDISTDPGPEQELAWSQREAWEAEGLAESAYDSSALSAACSHMADWHLSRLIAAGQDGDAIRLRRAIARNGCARWSEAESDFQWLLDRGMHQSEVYLGISEALAAQGQTEQAARHLAAAVVQLERLPDELNLPWQLQAGADGLTRVIASHPDDYRFWFRRAELYRRLERWSHAADDFSKCIELDYDGWWSRYLRGGCLVQLQRLDEAQADFDAAAQHSSGTWNIDHAWFALQLTRLLQGEVEAYRDACRQRYADGERDSSLELLLWASILLPEAVDDYQLLLEQVAQERAESFFEERAEIDSLYAALLLRSGRAEQALELLMPLKPTAEGKLFEALTHLHLGNADPVPQLILEAEALPGWNVWDAESFPRDTTWQVAVARRILKRQVQEWAAEAAGCFQPQ